MKIQNFFLVLKFRWGNEMYQTVFRVNLIYFYMILFERAHFEKFKYWTKATDYEKAAKEIFRRKYKRRSGFP